MKNQFTVVQDFYKSILEKRAAESKGTSAEEIANAVWSSAKDSRDIALRGVEENKKEQRKDLGQYLESAKKEEKADTKTMDKALDATDKDSTDTSNPLLKIAMNQAFFRGLRESEFLKVSSADYMKIVYSAFQDEMDKIAMFSMKGPGNILAGLGKGTAQVAKKPPPIPAAAMGPKSWKPGQTITGQSIANNGLPMVPGRG